MRRRSLTSRPESIVGLCRVLLRRRWPLLALGMPLLVGLAGSVVVAAGLLAVSRLRSSSRPSVHQEARSVGKARMSTPEQTMDAMTERVSWPQLFSDDRGLVIVHAAWTDPGMTRAAVRALRLNRAGDTLGRSSLIELSFPNGMTSVLGPDGVHVRLAQMRGERKWGLQRLHIDTDTLSLVEHGWSQPEVPADYIGEVRVGAMPDGRLSVSALYGRVSSGEDLVVEDVSGDDRGPVRVLDHVERGRHWSFLRSKVVVSRSGAVAFGWTRSRRDDDWQDTEVRIARLDGTDRVHRVDRAQPTFASYHREPAVAWEGERLIAAWGRPAHGAEEGRLRTSVWDPHSEPSDPLDLPAHGAPLTLLTDGHGHLVLLYTNRGVVHVQVLDRQGAGVGAAQVLPGVRPLGDELTGVFDGVGFALLWRSSRGMQLMRIDRAGRTLLAPRPI